MQIHSRKMNVSPDVNFDELARCTDDYNGAMLKAVCVEAVRGNLTCVPVSLPLYITGKGWSEYPVVYSWVSYFTKVREELFQLFVNKQLELILVPFATFFLVAIFLNLVLFYSFCSGYDRLAPWSHRGDSRGLHGRYHGGECEEESKPDVLRLKTCSESAPFENETRLTIPDNRDAPPPRPPIIYFFTS